MNNLSIKAKDKSLKTYLNRCRCCLESFLEDESISPITDFFAIQFFAFTRLELQTDDLLSNHVCEFCHSELLRFSVFKKDLIEKQLKLYNLLEHHKQSLFEKDDDIESIKSEEDIDDNEYEIDQLGSISENFTESEEDDVDTDHSSDQDFKVRGYKLPNSLKLFECDYCHIKFVKKQELIEHVQSHAEIKKEDFKCNSCEFSTTLRYKLLTHIKEFHDEKNVSNPSPPKKEIKKTKKDLTKSSIIEIPNPIKQQVRKGFKSIMKTEIEDSVEPEEVNETNLKAKSSIQSNQFQYRCFCGDTFKLKKSLDAHKNRKHGSLKKCNYGCGTKFETVNELIKHIRDLHPSYESEYLKMFQTSTENELNTEIKGNDLQIVTLTCQQCPYLASDKQDLYNHCQQKHNKIEGKVRCSECFKLFVSNSTLRTHMQTIHNDVRGFICSICSQAFKNNALLKYHLKKKHNTVYKPYSCSDCTESFEFLLELKKHKKDTHGEKNAEMKKSLTCACKKRFLYLNRLIWHQSNCKVFIDRQLTTKEPLKVGNHICKVCSKSYVMKLDLIRHQRTLGHKNI